MSVWMGRLSSLITKALDVFGRISMSLVLLFVLMVVGHFVAFPPFILGLILISEGNYVIGTMSYIVGVAFVVYGAGREFWVT